MCEKGMSINQAAAKESSGKRKICKSTTQVEHIAAKSPTRKIFEGLSTMK